MSDKTDIEILMDKAREFSYEARKLVEKAEQIEKLIQDEDPVALRREAVELEEKARQSLEDATQARRQRGQKEFPIIQEILDLISRGDEHEQASDDEVITKSISSSQEPTDVIAVELYFKDAKYYAVTNNKTKFAYEIEYILHQEPSYLYKIAREQDFESFRGDVSRIVAQIWRETYSVVKGAVHQHKLFLDEIVMGSVLNDLKSSLSGTDASTQQHGPGFSLDEGELPDYLAIESDIYSLAI